MAQSLGSDFKLYPAQFNGGFSETLQQNTEAFNAAGAGALRLVPERLRGSYDYESFFDVVSGIVSRRDVTSTSTASDTAVTQDEFVGVKCNRKIGPVAISLDALKKIGRNATPQDVSFALGEQVAKAVQVDYLNSALRSLEAALDAQSALEHDAMDGTIEGEDLIDGIAKFGDAADSIVLWVMHSKVYWNLVKDQYTDAVYRANGTRIVEGRAVTFDRPVLVTDSAALVESNGVSTGVSAYSTLGLTAGAAEILISEPENMVLDLITGYENMFYRLQGESAFNLRLKGFQWDVTNGAANPTDASLATGTNWDKVVTSDKLLPGVIIKSR